MLYRHFYAALIFVVLPFLGMFDAVAQDATSKRPNILFAISDDQSYPHASAYGETWVNTPNFDRIAQTGVLFKNAFVASPGCSPSRAAILTGLYPWQIEEAGTHASSFPKQYVCYPDILERAGYKIGYTGKGWGPGNWEVSGRERNPAGPAYQDKTLDPPAEGIRNTDYAANFEVFLGEKDSDQPFYFWYGSSEPHRMYQYGVNTSASEPTIPEFLPDGDTVQQDLLDYAYEIAWFDKQLGKMLDLLEEKGELENTLVIITSDNGMPFPRAKANVYEYGIHVPLAIACPSRFSGGRVVEDVVSLVDIMPTLLQLTDIPSDLNYPLSGESLRPILDTEIEGLLDPERVAYAGRERHSSSRYDNLTYPQRAIRSADYLYIRNFKPERWPAGAPQKYESEGVLGPPQGAYHDIDACPTFTYMIHQQEEEEVKKYVEAAVSKRPAEELYDIRQDQACLNNLAGKKEYEQVLRAYRAKLGAFLMETNDPRVTGKGDIYEKYPRLQGSIRLFPKPEE